MEIQESRVQLNGCVSSSIGLFCGTGTIQFALFVANRTISWGKIEETIPDDVFLGGFPHSCLPGIGVKPCRFRRIKTELLRDGVLFVRNSNIYAINLPGMMRIWDRLYRGTDFELVSRVLDLRDFVDEMYKTHGYDIEKPINVRGDIYMVLQECIIQAQEKSRRNGIDELAKPITSPEKLIGYIHHLGERKGMHLYESRTTQKVRGQMRDFYAKYCPVIGYEPKEYLDEIMDYWGMMFSEKIVLTTSFTFKEMYLRKDRILDWIKNREPNSADCYRDVETEVVEVDFKTGERKII